MSARTPADLEAAHTLLQLSEGAEITADDARFLAEMAERTVQTGLELQEEGAQMIQEGQEMEQGGRECIRMVKNWDHTRKKPM